MNSWNSDTELFALIRRELFVAVVGDVMDKLGFQHQFLPPQIKPLAPEMIVIGRAMPVLQEDIADTSTPTQEHPFGLLFTSLDDLKPNEVYLCTGGSPTYALWGELMSTRALKLGAAGAVMNGYSRDTKDILKLKFPTFSFGSYAQDQAPRGKVIDFRCPVEMGSVRVNPGDIVFGDIDGVCIVPRAAEKDVFNQALEKASTENLVRKAIEEGMSAADAFTKFGVL